MEKRFRAGYHVLMSDVFISYARSTARQARLVAESLRSLGYGVWLGLSDWNAEALSLEAYVQDMEAVVEAAGLERFPIFAISQGGAVAIEYAARHPERVSRLIF